MKLEVSVMSGAFFSFIPRLEFSPDHKESLFLGFWTLLHIQVSAGDESRMAGAEMSCIAGAEVSRMAGDGDVLYGRGGGVSYGRR